MLHRPATRADTSAVVDLCCRYEQEVRGFPDTDEDDVASDWADPGFDMTTQTLVVEDAGAVVGYAVVRTTGEADSVVDLGRRGDGLEDVLLDWLEQQPGRLEHYVPDVDEVLGATFARRGWDPARRFWRMRVELDRGPSAVPEAHWPAGVQVRDFDRVQDPRPVHALISTCFREIGGQHERTFEQWSSFLLETPKYDAALYLVAVADGEVVGASLSQDVDDYGIVRQLAVTPAFRGSGLALSLLHETFRRHAARGLPASVLGVDAANPTGALALYEKAGMRVHEQFTRWERPG